MKPPPPQQPKQGRGGGRGGGALGRRALASLLAAAVVALALLCLFYGAAFAPSIHPRLPLRRLGFRARATTGALPSDLVLSSIPVRAARSPVLSASIVTN
jgi:hypothetical protein